MQRCLVPAERVTAVSGMTLTDSLANNADDAENADNANSGRGIVRRAR